MAHPIQGVIIIFNSVPYLTFDPLLAMSWNFAQLRPNLICLQKNPKKIGIWRHRVYGDVILPTKNRKKIDNSIL